MNSTLPPVNNILVLQRKSKKEILRNIKDFFFGGGWIFYSSGYFSWDGSGTLSKIGINLLGHMRSYISVQRSARSFGTNRQTHTDILLLYFKD